MINRGKKYKLNYNKGEYYLDSLITKEEWKKMLLSKDVIDENSKLMLLKWYNEINHQSTCKNMMLKYNEFSKGVPYNGIVKGLVTRVHKYLGYRFWVEQESYENRESFWPVVFYGWYEGNYFVWKLRDEIVEAINELPQFTKSIENDYVKSTNKESDYESITPSKDGKKVLIYTTKYERDSKNRALAINYAKKTKGRLECECCGFNFEEVYGDRGKDFIEVHHNKPLYTLEQEMDIDPIKDLSCLCSNCHRMIHKYRNNIISVDELKDIINKRKVEVMK